MKPIIHIKDSLWGNLATTVFLLALAACAVWLDYHSHGTVSIVVWIFAALFVLFCYIPLDHIRHPKSRTLLIEDSQLVWRVRAKDGEAVLEERLPLRQICALRFVIPSSTNPRRKLQRSYADLYFITLQGLQRELPPEFFPGVYRDRIITAVREHIPNVQVEEITDAA
jgi:hypothetical protein